MTKASDTEYLEIITAAIRVCADYRPRFGHGRAAGFTVAEFKELYQADPFYSWFGLDNPLMYAAHRAAGGMTSVYRQIGIGCQWAFNRILRDSLGIDEEAANWSYKVPGATGGRERTLSLTQESRPLHFRQALERMSFDLGSPSLQSALN